MLDELRQWGLTPPPVVADAGYGEVTAFRAALEQRELAYVVEVKAQTSAYGEEVLPERTRLARLRAAAAGPLPASAGLAALPGARHRG